MTKGGARAASAKKAVAKGMGINVFFNVLEEISRLNDWISVDLVMKNLHFGGNRNETCRSYFKELWRYGLVDRKEGIKIIKCNETNWRKGGRPLYKISEKGKELLLVPDKHRVFALAWIIARADNEDDFEQLHLAFNAFKKGDVPLSMFKACKITGIVRDSIKAIMYGWLEPLGFIDRTGNGTFRLNKKYYNGVKSICNIDEAIPENKPYCINTTFVRISTIPNLEPSAPEIDNDIKIPFNIFNKGKELIKIRLICRIYPLFENKFKTSEIIKEIEIKSNQTIKDTISFSFEIKAISESFKRTELGHYEIKFNEETYSGALPTISLTTKSRLHELNLEKLLSEIGYIPIPFSKSDRPDMIIFPERNEIEEESFLHNDEFKILVETTSSERLSVQKIEDDLKNFKEHTTKVLKINAKRTLLVGNSLAKNVEKNIPDLLKKYHPFTVITMNDLDYLKYKIFEKKDNSWKTVGKVLTYNGVVKRKFIDSVFS